MDRAADNDLKWRVLRRSASGQPWRPALLLALLTLVGVLPPVAAMAQPGGRDHYGGRGGYGGGYERGSYGRAPAYGGGAYARPPRAPAYPPAGYRGRDGFGGPPGSWRNEQAEVREAVREGRRRPLGQVIETVRQRAPGRLLDAGVEPGPNGRPAYRLRWASQDGRRMDFLVDAETGGILAVEGGR